jgi:DNA ligase (NAD+)
MDIEGLGEKNVQLLYEKGLIKNFEDIYRLQKNELEELPRFAEKSAQNLIDAIEKSKNTTMAKFLFAIGILHVGEYAAKLLAKNFERLEDLYHVKQEHIEGIRQIGEKIASSVSNFFGDEKNLNALNSLKTLGLTISNPDFAAADKGHRPLEGMSFVITGILPISRKEVENLIESSGGHASSAVSRSTDYLVVGVGPGSKLEKAKSLGIQTLSYNELLKMLAERIKHPRLF